MIFKILHFIPLVAPPCKLCLMSQFALSFMTCNSTLLLFKLVPTRTGSVLKPKPKPRFSVKTEPKPKPRFRWESKSVLRLH